MFGIWEEIFATIRKNKLRTFLTGFSVSWGIFMLIILLGSGNGLKNAVLENFKGRARNSMKLWSGYTGMPYKGFPKGREVKFGKNDLPNLKREFSNIGAVSATVYQSVTLSYGKEYISSTLYGVAPELTDIEDINIRQGDGRFINDLDMHELRKVIVIHKTTARILFGERANPLGKYLIANKMPYKIIGIYNDDNTYQSPRAYIPLSTADKLYNPRWGYGDLSFTVEGLDTEQANMDFEKELRKRMGIFHNFDPSDIQAVYVWNRLEDYMQSIRIFNGISLFVWIIGIGTLIAGVVGVGNIMLISIKERTKEIGIRKTLGASPWSVLKLVVLEAIVITTLFGYIGMIAGVGATELANYFVNQNIIDSGGENMMFRNPTVEVSIVFSATAVLIIAGVLAGYFPARKAVSIKPIEALRYE